MPSLDTDIGFKIKQVPVKKMTVTVKVEITKQFRFRMWIGKHVLHFLAWLWDCDIEIKQDLARIREV